MAGCTSPPVSVRPLYTAAEWQRPTVEPRIEGEWISPPFGLEDDDQDAWITWKITAVEMQERGGYYQVEVGPAKPTPDWNGQPMTYELRLVSIGDSVFFDAQHALSSKEGDLGPLGLVPLHWVGRLWVEEGFLRILLLDGDWVDENLPDTFRVPSNDRGQKDGQPIITATTEELRNMLQSNAHDQKAFTPTKFTTYLCRRGTDCGVRAVEDMLARAPNDEEIFATAGRFFLKRGSYARAVAMQRRAMDATDAKNSKWHADLGDLLLLNREFEAARREFAIADEVGGAPGGQPADPAHVHAVAREGIVWSYFLEGRFADASRAAASGQGTLTSVSVNSILLGYMSLLRIGNRAAAESWLKEQTASFTGSPEEQILLLSVLGRVKGTCCPEKPPNVTDLDRAKSLTAAAAAIADGDPKKLAPGLLEAALENAPKDSLVALAARIEVENLRAGACR